MRKSLLWDFDGTLGYRKDGLYGRAWSGAMFEAIRLIYPNSNIKQEDIQPLLTTGFPWHEPEKSHTHLSSSELWWTHIENIFTKGYLELGFTENQSVKLSALARERYVDLNTWELYEDTLPVLKSLRDQGWKHFIVSNHVPQLNTIINHLKVNELIEDVINSAEVGYEKPNPEIYKIAMNKVGTVDGLWMIGDNVLADVLGAESVGIKGILVRTKDFRAKYQFEDLCKLEEFLQNNTSKT